MTDSPLSTDTAPPRSFRDAETGREIWQLTEGPDAHLHSYYDVSPWSPDGRELVYSSVAPDSLQIAHGDNLASEEARVVTLDLSTWTERTLASGAFFTTHTGTYATWHPSGERVYFFRTKDTVEAADRRTGGIVRRLHGGLRQFHPDGSRIAYTTRQDRAGVYSMAEDGTDIRCLATVEELHAITPNRDQFAAEDMHVKNTKWSPDGSALLVANGVWSAPFVNVPSVARSLYLIYPESGEKHWLCHFGHHHSWTPDGRGVLFCGKLETGEPRIFRAELDTGELSAVCDEPLEGHPIANGDGSLIATEDDDGVVVVDAVTRRTRRVARYGRRFDKTHRGTHSHCVWSPDGKQLLYNSAESGLSQIYLIRDP